MFNDSYCFVSTFNNDPRCLGCGFAPICTVRRISWYCRYAYCKLYSHKKHRVTCAVYPMPAPRILRTIYILIVTHASLV
jgi:hypothetical protein